MKEVLSPAPPQPDISELARAAVGSCMLVRELATTHNLGPNEIPVVSQLVLDGAATVPVIEDVLRTKGTATHPRAVERSMFSIRQKANGLLVTTNTGYRQPPLYSLDQKMLTETRQVIADRHEKAQMARQKINEWLGGHLEERIKIVPDIRDHSPYINMLRALIENIGWSVRSGVLVKAGGIKVATNPSIFIKRLEELLPEGLISKSGTKNFTGYSLDIERLLSMEKPEQEKLIDLPDLGATAKILGIRSQRAMDILAVLCSAPNRVLLRTELNALLEAHNLDVPRRERLYEALKVLRRHGLIKPFKYGDRSDHQRSTVINKPIQVSDDYDPEKYDRELHSRRESHIQEQERIKQARLSKIERPKPPRMKKAPILEKKPKPAVATNTQRPRQKEKPQTKTTINTRRTLPEKRVLSPETTERAVAREALAREGLPEKNQNMRRPPTVRGQIQFIADTHEPALAKTTYLELLSGGKVKIPREGSQAAEKVRSLLSATTSTGLRIFEIRDGGFLALTAAARCRGRIVVFQKPDLITS